MEGELFHWKHVMSKNKFEIIAIWNTFITLLLSTISRNIYSFFLVRSTQFFRHSINSKRPWHHNRFLSACYLCFSFQLFFCFVPYFIAFCLLHCIMCIAFHSSASSDDWRYDIYLCNLSCSFALSKFSQRTSSSY